MIKSAHLRDLIIDPTIKLLEIYSPSASDLLMGTAAKETLLGYYLKQEPGPARGIFQQEPKTGKLVLNWVNKNLDFDQLQRFYCLIGEEHACEYTDRLDWKMVYDLRTQTIFARYLYYSIPVPLPKREDFFSWRDYIFSLGEYWDKYYNRNPNHGTPKEFVECYFKYIRGK